jgi:hypothetical protein
MEDYDSLSDDCQREIGQEEQTRLPRAVRPHGIKCGKCKQSHATVADVRSCYATCEHGLSADLCEGPQHYLPTRFDSPAVLPR